MSVLLSEVNGELTVLNGTLSAQASSFDDVTVLDSGHAVLSGCHIEAISSTDEATSVPATGSKP